MLVFLSEECDSSSSSSSVELATHTSVALTPVITFAQRDRSMTEACWRRRRRLWAYLADQGWNLQLMPDLPGTSTVVFRPSQPTMDPEESVRHHAPSSTDDMDEVVWCGDRANVAVSTSPSFDYAFARSRKIPSGRSESKSGTHHGKRASTANPASLAMANRFEELTLRSCKPIGVKPSRSLHNLSSSAHPSLRAVNASPRPLGLAMEGAGIVACPKVPHSAQARTTTMRSNRSSEEDYAVSQRPSPSTALTRPTKSPNSHRPASFVNLNLDMRRDKASSDDEDGCSCISDDNAVPVTMNKRGAVTANDGLAWHSAAGSFPPMASSVGSTASGSVAWLPGEAGSLKLDRFCHNQVFGNTEPLLTQRQPRTLSEGHNPKPVSADWPRAGRQSGLPHNRKNVHLGQSSRRRTSNYDRRGQPIITLVSLTSTSPEPVEKPDKEPT